MMMTKISFLHLSDIHFGQEKGGEVFYHDDVKEQVIRHARELSLGRSNSGERPISGVIVTGDIAYSGKEIEYGFASAWLKRLTEAVGCHETDVQVVPGNHDIDRDKISNAARLMLESVVAGGQKALDSCLKTEADREILYERFTDYRPFAYGYGCILDQEGGRAGEKIFKLSDGFSIRFNGMNSALVCKAKDMPGDLMLGARQHVIHEEDDIAEIVLSHHPLHWFADEASSRTYLQHRTAVLLSGHEHQASWKVDEIDGQPRFLSIAAGALIPPHATDDYNYAYNVIEFSLSDDREGITVKVFPYCWDKTAVCFANDRKLCDEGRDDVSFYVKCPTFRPTQYATPSASSPPHESPSAALHSGEEPEMQDERFPRLRLIFFQKLGPLQRLRVLDALDLIPAGVKSVPNLSTERYLIERLRDDRNKVSKLEEEISKQMNSGGDDKK